MRQCGGILRAAWRAHFAGWALAAVILAAAALPPRLALAQSASAEAQSTRPASSDRSPASVAPACGEALDPPFVYARHEERYAERLDFIANRLTRGSYATVGLGDSIMQRWPNEILAEMFGGPVLNAGVNGDGVPQLLHRLETMPFAAQAPVDAVLMIGTNDLARGAGGCAVADGILAVVARLHEIWPDTAITVFAILPRGEDLTEFAPEITAANARLRAAQEAGGFVLADVGEAFIQRCGTPLDGTAAAIAEDCTVLQGPGNVHPTLPGYEMIGERLGIHPPAARNAPG